MNAAQFPLEPVLQPPPGALLLGAPTSPEELAVAVEAHAEEVEVAAEDSPYAEDAVPAAAVIVLDDDDNEGV